MAGREEEEEELRGDVSDGAVPACKCGCCEEGDKAEGTLGGGQVHYGKGGEFTLESQRGVHMHAQTARRSWRRLASPVG